MESVAKAKKTVWLNVAMAAGITGMIAFVVYGYSLGIFSSREAMEAFLATPLTGLLTPAQRQALGFGQLDAETAERGGQICGVGRLGVGNDAVKVQQDALRPHRRQSASS